MRPFKDKEGREWRLEMNVAQAKRLKDRLDIDVLDGGHSVNKLAQDPYTAANVLYVLCEQQATAAGISDEQFGALLAGDSFDDATTALLEELVDFFPKRQRETWKKMLAALATAKGDLVNLADRKLDSPELKTGMANLLKQAEAEIDAEIAKLVGPNSGAPSA